MNTARSAETPDPTLRNNPRDCHLIKNIPGSWNLYLVRYIYEFRKFKTIFIIACHEQAKRIYFASAHFFPKSIIILLHLRLATFFFKKCIRVSVHFCACYILSHLN